MQKKIPDPLITKIMYYWKTSTDGLSDSSIIIICIKIKNTKLQDKILRSFLSVSTLLTGSTSPQAQNSVIHIYQMRLDSVQKTFYLLQLRMVQVSVHS